MCGIFASFNRDTILELAKLNSYRGQRSHSVTVFLDNPLVNWSVKEMGPFTERAAVPIGYKICHIQAPTTTASADDSIHPAEITREFMLWHNGLIKSDDIERLQYKHKTSEKWDTKLLLREVMYEQFSNLSEIDGSFACFLKTPGGLFVFRNEISPLFYNDHGDFSSVKYGDMKPLPENTVFRIDLNWEYTCVTLTKVAEFTTFENPYFFGD